MNLKIKIVFKKLKTNSIKWSKTEFIIKIIQPQNWKKKVLYQNFYQFRKV